MTTIQEMIDRMKIEKSAEEQKPEADKGELEEVTSNKAAGFAANNWTASIKLARQLAATYKGIKGSFGKSEMSDKHKKEIEQCYADAQKCLKRAAVIFNDYS